MSLYVSVVAPHEWARTDADGKVVDSGTAASLSDVAPPRDRERIVGVVPGERVLTRSVQVPSRRRQRVLAALPYALEESLTADIESLHFALLDWKPGGAATAAVVSRELMRSWSGACAEAGLVLDALVPDYLMLPSHPQTHYTVARMDDDRVCIREPGNKGVALPLESVEFWWRDIDPESAAVAVNDADLARKLIATGGKMVSEWPIGRTFTEWLGHHAGKHPGVNLLQGQFRATHKRQRFREFRPAAALLGAALVLKVGADVGEYVWLERRNTQLDQQILESFRGAFPNITRIVNPRAQMQRQVELLRGGDVTGGEFQRLLAAVANALPGASATLDEITYRDNVMVVTCNTPDFAGLDRVRQRLEAAPQIRAELLSSGSRDNQVTGRFQLRGSGT